jgi:uncharacterized protein (UPF0303 family)
MNVDKYIVIAEKQEELLQFSHFTKLDAWGLGNELAKRVLDNKLPLSISIRLFSGISVFQYFGEGTTVDNEYWMSKKFNTVREVETSSLLFSMRLMKQKQTLQDRTLDPAKFAWGGGGFPLRIKNAGVIGAIVVSGLPSLKDHDTIVDAAAAFLKIDTVPRIPLNIKI